LILMAPMWHQNDGNWIGSPINNNFYKVTIKLQKDFALLDDCFLCYHWRIYIHFSIEKYSNLSGLTCQCYT
jgi:hypothetical protein